MEKFTPKSYFVPRNPPSVGSRWRCERDDCVFVYSGRLTRVAVTNTETLSAASCGEGGVVRFPHVRSVEPGA